MSACTPSNERGHSEALVYVAERPQKTGITALKPFAPPQKKAELKFARDGLADGRASEHGHRVVQGCESDGSFKLSRLRT